MTDDREPVGCCKCHQSMSLDDGCEWGDSERLYCWGCAHDELERLLAIVEADDRRFAWLAGGGVDCGPVVEGFSVLLDDFWCFLGDAIRERIGEENDSPDIEDTDEDRIKSFRAMIDAAMAAEKARNP